MIIKGIIVGILAALMPYSCYAGPKCGRQLRIAVIDTGLDLKDPRFSKHLCRSGHKNFVVNGTLDDVNGHGTAIAGLIQQFAGKANYCLLIYKYYSKDNSGVENLKAEVLSIREAVRNNADIVNISGGGQEFNKWEHILIRSHPKMTFVVAAGNEGKDLDIPGNEYYPASYGLKNIIAVSNIESDGTLHSTSNYGKDVTAREMGTDVSVIRPGGLPDIDTGTSISAAIHTGKLVDKLSKTCSNR